MEKLTEVLTTGNGMAYVWPSFIITGLIMLAMTWTSWRSLQKAQKTLKELQDTTQHDV